MRRDRERVARYKRQSTPRTIFVACEHLKVLSKRLVSGLASCKTRNEHRFVDRALVTVNTNRNYVLRSYDTRSVRVPLEKQFPKED